MKGYALLLLLAAALLLLLPLPALSRSDIAATPSADASATPSQSTTDNIQAAPNTSAKNQFRILSDDKVLSVEDRDFLIRTLAFEMSPTYHAEALKAQAVAAYTYYGRRRLAQAESPDPSLKGAHFKAPVAGFPQNYSIEKMREKWGNQFDTHYNKLAAAVDAVYGHYITADGQWIDACYFAISHGTTESAATVWGSDIPYLRSVASPADKLAPGYESTVTLTPDRVKAALLAHDSTLALSENPASWFGATQATATGSLKSVTIGNKTIPATAIRSALELRSTHFSVTYADNTFQFTTRGYGHGVGMSQYGADYLARQGYTWQEILQYYYTGITIV